MPFEKFTPPPKGRKSFGFAGRLYTLGPNLAISLAAPVRRAVATDRVEVLYDPERRAIALRPSDGGEGTFKVGNPKVSMTGLATKHGIQDVFDGRIVPCKREGDLFVFEIEPLEAP